MMKKVVALVLALGVSALLFAACDTPAETTTKGTDPVETTTAQGGTATSDTTTAATTTTTEAKRPLEFTDSNVIDSVSYDYYIQLFRNEAGEITNVAVSGWKKDSVKSNIVIGSQYDVRDELGNLTTYTATQVGTGQGVVHFQTVLKTVEIQEGITKIANKAFSMCTKLESISLPAGLTSIGDMAFWMCGSLESLEIPSTVTEIGKMAFNDCSSLKTVTLPRAFESRAAELFDGCSEELVITYID